MLLKFSDSQQPYAIVIGLDSTTGLQTARILASRQVPVIALAKDANHYCCRTRVCQKILFVDTDSDALIETLEGLGPQLNQKAVLFPCEDLIVLLLSRHRRQLEPWYHLVLPQAEVVEMLLDKLSFYQYAQKKELPIPRTFFIHNQEEAQQAAKELSFPCVVKPPVKTLEWQQHSQEKVYKVSSALEFLDLYESCQGWIKTLIVQEWIAGNDTNHYSCNCYFNAAAEPVVTFTTRKLRQWPSETGQGCLAVECRNEMVLHETVRLFQSLPYRGLGYLEMKQDERSGEYFIVEPNIGRPTGRSAMAEAAGVELLYTMYCDALGRPLPANREQQYRGVKWFHLRRDVPVALARWRQGSLTLKEWWCSYQGPKVDAVFSWRDPWPFLAELEELLVRLFRKLGRRFHLLRKPFGSAPRSQPLHPLAWLFVGMLPLLAACTPTIKSHPETVPLAEISYPKTRPVRTVYPEQLASYIPNPGMGWQDTQRRNKRFEETVAYRRFNWDVLNPAEGIFDWSLIEKLRTETPDADNDISFRIRTAQPPPWGEGQTMPAWLVKQGGLITDGHSEVEGVRSTEPVYSGCLFLEAHGQFIEALRQRYDGDPAVAFIDIGSYGTYGEWDSEQYDEEPGSLDWHARRRIIDMYTGGQGMRPCLKGDKQIEHVAYQYTGFQQTQLVMPYTPWFADSLRYALNRREDIGIRHDALGSAKHQQRYRREIGTWVEKRWPHAPIVFELTSTADTAEALRRARDFAQEMHASFIHDNLSGRGSDKLLEDLLAVVGYRFVLRAITYTSELGPGETLSVEMAWQNMGVAPLYRETYPLVLSLTDAQGEPVLEQELEPNLQDWLPEKVINLPAKISLPANLPAGQYDLRLAFVDPATRQSALALAIAGRDEEGRYLMGPVHVVR